MSVKWDERFGEKDYAYGTEPNDFLRIRAHVLPRRGKILCICEGEGRNAVYLAQEDFKVTAMDASKVGMEKALALAEEKNVDLEYFVSDIENFDMGKEKWDGIVSISAHFPSKLAKNVYKRAEKALKDNGVFMLEGYNAGQLEYDTGGPKDADRLVSLDMLKASFQTFQFLHQIDTIRDVTEGKYHTGEASVTQFIAQKI